MDHENGSKQWIMCENMIASTFAEKKRFDRTCVKENAMVAQKYAVVAPWGVVNSDLPLYM